MEDYDIDEVIKGVFNDDPEWTPSQKIELIDNEIDKLKDDLRLFLRDCKCDFTSVLQESQTLCSLSNKLMEDMEALKQEIKEEAMAELEKSIENHNSITKELSNIDFVIKIIFDIVQCNRLFNEYVEYRNELNYRQCVECINTVLEIMEYPSEGFNTMTMYQSIKSRAIDTYDTILNDLTETWEENVIINKESSEKKSSVTLSIKLEDTDEVSDMIEAMRLCKLLQAKIRDFSTFLLNDLLVPIIRKDSYIVYNIDDITVNFKTKSKPKFEDVLHNLKSVIGFLSKKMNLLVENRETLMTLIGKEIATQFSDILINECLIDTVPNNINDLQAYEVTTRHIEDFQHYLKAVNFFSNNQISILAYIDNIDTLFSEKSSQYFLETARTIMLKDLSVTMSIGVESLPDKEKSSEPYVDIDTEEALKIFNKAVPKSLFYFPRCMISKSTQELLDLVFMMMEQAVQCSDMVCEKLYVTTRLVFELYDAVVPYHHENFLQTIPQYVALFHNNCMYLAHNLQTLGDKWMKAFEGRGPPHPVGFIDLVPKIRDMGYRHLAVHMQQQRKQILDNIRSSDLNCIVVKDILDDNAEQAIRQCLRQLQLLKNVWIGVFPHNVFTKLMATLVNMFVEELIHRVCSVEDISAEMATQLTDMYTLVVNKAPNLFQSHSDIEGHVKSWVKLQELILILGGSLKDIERRWGEGTGPLAVQFRVEELRNLIKALFQNTQYRANLLSKIK